MPHHMPTFAGPIDLRMCTSPRPIESSLVPFRKPANPPPGFLHSLLAAEQFHENPLAGTRMSPMFVGDRLLETSAFSVPRQITGETLQEISARLLFSIVNWIRHIAGFRALVGTDQVSACGQAKLYMTFDQ
jgi:hypothetical protein